MKIRKLAAVFGTALLLTASPAFAEEEIGDYDYFEEPDDNTITRAKNTPRSTPPDNGEEIDEEGSADGWFFKGGEQYPRESEPELSEEEKRIEKIRKQRAKVKANDEKNAKKKAAKEEKRIDKEARAEEKAIEKDEKANRKFARQQRTRYAKLFKDNEFTYYMDTSTAHWVKVPYSAESKMIDVWIQLVEGDNRAQVSTVTKEDEAGQYEIKNSAYTPPTKYYLEHYYLWPERNKIQFLCELEVTGKPDNVVEERKYNFKNWEDLVPGSIEDNIYRSVVARMNKKDSILGIPTQGRSGRDMLEEYGRISL